MGCSLEIFMINYDVMYVSSMLALSVSICNYIQSGYRKTVIINSCKNTFFVCAVQFVIFFRQTPKRYFFLEKKDNLFVLCINIRVIYMGYS